MSLQWTLIAGFLYLEVAVVLLLVLPVASPKRWNSLFKSRFLQAFRQQASFYFMILLAALILFLLDAIREMRKYSHHEEGEHRHLDAEMQENMRLFRAQRNFYISSFALFLSLVIKRLISLISSQAALLAQSEAALKQAASATTAARSYMKKDSEPNEEVDNLKKQIEELENELTLQNKDKAALKKQADNLTAEYDRLSEEHSKLQKTIALTGDKKDD